GRHEPNAGMGRVVIGGASAVAPTAPRPGSPARDHRRFDRIGRLPGISHRLVNEALDRLHLIEYRFVCNGIHEGLVPQPAWVGQSFSCFRRPPPPPPRDPASFITRPSTAGRRELEARKPPPCSL